MAKIPYGAYEVTIEDLMLKKNKETGDPIVFCDMQIAAGKFKGKRLAVEQVVKNGVQIYRVNAFLRALCAEIGTAAEIEFKTYSQYFNLLADMNIYGVLAGRPCRVLFTANGYEVGGLVLCP